MFFLLAVSCIKTIDNQLTKKSSNFIRQFVWNLPPRLGHVMHCLCTRTRFSMLSWAWPMVPWPGGVEQDFLEVPSMALEKFACEPVLLQRVAKHFSGQGPKLEDKVTRWKFPKRIHEGSCFMSQVFFGGKVWLGNKRGICRFVSSAGIEHQVKVISKIKELETWMAGLGESRYFASSLFDLMIHSQAPPYSFEGEEGLSSAELYRRVMQKYTTLAQLPKTNYSASWYPAFSWKTWKCPSSFSFFVSLFLFFLFSGFFLGSFAKLTDRVWVPGTL